MNPIDRTLAWRPAPAIFPMVLGADGASVVERAGEGARRFSRGEELFGQLLIAPLGSAGTYAEYVAGTEDAPLARVPGGLDPVLAAALPTAGGTGLALRRCGNRRPHQGVAAGRSTAGTPRAASTS